MSITGLRNLCTPAHVYFVISIIVLTIMFIQNLGNINVYCLGVYKCDVSSVSLIFTIKLLYILFWTWLLNIICKNGSPEVAWFLLLFPFLILFIMLAMLMISQ